VCQDLRGRRELLAVKESEFQDQVIQFAVLRRWQIVHFRPARVTIRGQDTYRTATQGHNGFVDLVIARNGTVIHAELKTETGKLSDDQKKWRDALGTTWRLWRPSDWPAIEKELM